MTEIQIGSGGWWYFNVPGEDPLSAYSKAFDFVEVNSTFYEYPDLEMVRSWRRGTFREFEFTVRCHHDVTHKRVFEPSKENISSMNRMLRICETLEAPILHMQVPQNVNFSDEHIVKIRNLLESLSLGRVRVALQFSRKQPRPLDTHVTDAMRDFNIIHSVDLSWENPAYKSDIVYGRLFGPTGNNVYQFSDEELQEVNAKASRQEFERSVLVFHGIKMYKDAARLKVFRSTEVFPMATSNLGVESIREVLTEDAVFPTSKSALIHDQGWKIIDLTLEKRTRASTVLVGLPNRQYQSVRDVVDALGGL